jgi:hypothetical protein
MLSACRIRSEPPKVLRFCPGHKKRSNRSIEQYSSRRTIAGSRSILPQPGRLQVPEHGEPVSLRDLSQVPRTK